VMGSRNAELPLADRATEKAVAERRPDPEAAASCRGGLAHSCQSRSRGWTSLATWGARPGTRARPWLRSWPLDRRSGCSSAEPYPPSRPSAIVAAPRLGANRPLKLSGFVKPGAAPRCVAAGLVSRACPLGFWPRPSKTVLPLAGITDTGPAREGQPYQQQGTTP
jgi:hypothetical protein